MDDEKFAQLKAAIGEEAALRYEMSQDAGNRLLRGEGKPLDPVSWLADGALFKVYATGHLLKEGALFVGREAEHAASAVSAEFQHVTGQDKPLETPPFGPTGPQVKGK